MKTAYGVRLHRSDCLSLPAHPDTPDAEDWRIWATSRSPVAVDLFCGAGGLSLGLKQAGFDVIAAVDSDKRALVTHSANFPGRAVQMDLAIPAQVDELVKMLSGIAIDVLAGGPPCQPFSRAGRSKIRSLVAAGDRPEIDKRRDLWQVFVDLAVRLGPAAILFENVPDMALCDSSATIRSMAAGLEEADYRVDYRLVDAWRYSVPQHRRRLILVATRAGTSFKWPDPEGRVSVEDAIADLPSLGIGIGGRTLNYQGPSSSFQRAARNGMPDEANSLVWDHMTRPVREDDREAFALMTSQTRYSDLPERLRRYRTDIFNDKYKRLSWNDLSRTITAHIAKDGYWYIHPSENRTLTVREAARLQTFPDWFRFAGTRSHAFAQIGNAVPPALAAAIATSLLDTLRNAREGRRGKAVSTPRPVHSFRRKVLNWKPSRSDMWRQIGNPWQVLVSTICGRRGSGDLLARKIIDNLPVPLGDNSEGFKRVRLLGEDELSSRRVARSLQAAITIARMGWDDESWIKASELGPADARWVEAVGLHRYDLLATTGVLRVAARFGGASKDTTAQTKVVLAQLVGTSSAIEITVAMAALAVEVCTATAPSCTLCPLTTECAYSQAVGLSQLDTGLSRIHAS